MSKPTVSAAGAVMPAEGHKTRRALLRLFGAAPALAILPAVDAAATLSPPSCLSRSTIEAIRTGR